jgi:O-acetylhomoserine (thiol)-lyase
MNPTEDVREKRLAALEGGIGALALASGMAAITYAIQTIAESGDTIVSASQLHGGLPDHPEHSLLQRYMGGRASGILSFTLKGQAGREGGARFPDALEPFTRRVNIGDAKSLATHPASTTHRQLNPQELAKAGVSEGMVRLSIGIEHIEDLKADLERALAAV